ncbi:hypothetical protein [Streptacidiphilus albus]|uniref:hypothetical protein n=1 Tax=Streptacidiphilus albus TaxID=105425 RepID=UPI00054B59B7|nr:hypothetical protein [Streptacidiphilus albus]
MIPPLTSFTVLPEYGRSWTVYDVVPKGESSPVLRLRKESRYDSQQPFHAFTGPGLDQLDGYVTVGAAMGADRVKHGTVGHRNGSALRSEEWSFAQAGLPVLEGEPAGASALRHSFPLRAVLANGIADSALSFRLRYRGPGSAGFEFTRLAGARARYTVEVHDDRLSRLLVLAAVLRHSVFSDSDVRQYRVDLTTNPLKG